MKIGLEIHGYMDCEQKLFCTCKIDRKANPNTTICPICTSQPGSKPMLPDEQAVRHIIAMALFLGCTINKRLQFQRKHYSWPDLPSGYQKTMSGAYSTPTAENGNFLGVRITEIHIEEDPARWNPETGLVDYNRSGYPLIEIVTEPDFESAEHVENWVKNLLTAFAYIRAIDPAAGIKCDVNVSTEQHPRVEVKNVNSITGMVHSIKYEEQRQQSTTEERVQQTRSWNDAEGVTHFMRSKENAMDYRFIPEPDLPIIVLSDEYINAIRETLPETPSEKYHAYLEKGLDEETAKAISDDVVLAEFFDLIVHKTKNEGKAVAPWIRRDVANALSDVQLSRDEVQAKADLLVDWIDIVLGRKMNPVLAKKLLPNVLLENLDIKKHMNEENLGVQGNESELEVYCRESIKNNPVAVTDYKAGKQKAFNSLVGFVMAKTKGKADPVTVAELMKKVIENG